MRRIRIYPYKMGSASAKALRDALGAKLVFPDRDYKYLDGDLIINWGNSSCPDWGTDEAMSHVLNKPIFVVNATDKIRCFKTLYSSEIPVPEFTTCRDDAHDWIDGGHRVYARMKIDGHSGEGIEVVDKNKEISFLSEIADKLESNGYTSLVESVEREMVFIDEQFTMPDAPLYTKEIKNNGEYRVHVFNGEVIDYRKKSRRVDDEPTQEQSDVRNHENGWIYRMGNLERLEKVENLAKSAIKALSLDFGTVDIIKDMDNNVFVLEVNTACGLEGTTLDKYVNAISNYANK